MEVVGRYATADEMDEFEVRGDTPVWLPTKPELLKFSAEIRNGLIYLRKVKFLNVTEYPSKGLVYNVSSKVLFFFGKKTNKTLNFPDKTIGLYYLWCLIF